MTSPVRKLTIRPAMLEWLGTALKLHQVLDEDSGLERVLESLPAISLEVWPKGKDILVEGEPGDDFFVLFSGRASVWRARDFPRPRKLGSLRAGEFFGEIGLFMKGVRSATVRPEEDCTVFRFPAAEFEAILAKHKITRKWVDRVARRRVARIFRFP